MKSLNKACLIGNLGKDVESKFTPGAHLGERGRIWDNVMRRGR